VELEALTLVLVPAPVRALVLAVACVRKRMSAELAVVEMFMTTSTPEAELPGVIGVDGLNMHCA
jgi:hypothetical protein